MSGAHEDVEVVAVEEPFSVLLHNPDTDEVLEERLTGFIDLVVLEDGHPVVVEHKTAAKKYGADQLRFDVQLTGYQYAMHQRGWADVGLRFQIVTKTKTPVVQVEDVLREGGDEVDFLRTVVGVLKAIDAGVFFPVRGWQCRGCQFRRRCGARP
jgi:CRISPR/Cas system-associated exonuclease Cas4 (RecB family)